MILARSSSTLPRPRKALLLGESKLRQRMLKVLTAQGGTSVDGKVSKPVQQCAALCLASPPSFRKAARIAISALWSLQFFGHELSLSTLPTLADFEEQLLSGFGAMEGRKGQGGSAGLRYTTHGRSSSQWQFRSAVWVTASILQPNSKFLDSPIMPFPSFSFSSALSRFPSPLYCPLRIIPAQCPFCSSTPIQHSNGSDVASICRILSSFLAPCVPNLSDQWRVGGGASGDSGRSREGLESSLCVNSSVDWYRKEREAGRELGEESERLYGTG
eukprot:3909903-Rhodomonas_salina.1